MHRSWPLSIMLVSSDSELQAQLKHTCKAASVTVVKEPGQVPKLLDKKAYDIVLSESKANTSLEVSLAGSDSDPQHPLVISGSKRALRQAISLVQSFAPPTPAQKSANGTSASLEDLIQSKVSDFVKGMRNGSARNLYPILMSAVERPLLSSTLQETQGNQIQAARLLGMNRNTLRKKITELHIPLTRTKSAQRMAH